MIGMWTKLRIALLGVGLAAIAFAVGKQAWELQLEEYELPGLGKRWLRDMATWNYMTNIELPPRRGRILDRHEQELAGTAEFDAVACNPRQMEHVPDGWKRLGKALGMTEREVRKAVEGRERSYFAWVKHVVTEAEVQAVKALKLPAGAVSIKKVPRRVYPHRALASTVIGHVNRDGKGLEGVESAFEAALRGSRSRVQSYRDAKGRPLLLEGGLDAQATAGKDLVLSIDSTLTYFTEKALRDAVKKHNAKSAVAVMLDARTSEVLALASVPDYDPNEPAQMLKNDAQNRAIKFAYEPGSTMKTFTFAAAFEHGRLRPTDPYYCENGRRIPVGKHTIGDSHPLGNLTAAEVLQHSSNICTYKIARNHLTKEKLRAALVEYGFGKATGLGLEHERHGDIPALKRWADIVFANVSFGQGLTVTPLQMAAGYAMIANRGVYRTPRLGLRVVHPDGRSEPVPPPPTAREDRVISEKTAGLVMDILRTVTEPGGTATRAAIPGYPVAGKTGTAQKVVNGRYGAYIASFIGIVPAQDPRLVIAVVVDEPKPDHLGGLVAAPVFKEIAEPALRYLTVPALPIVAKGSGKDGGKDAGKDAKAAKAGAAAPGPPVDRRAGGVAASPAEQEGPGTDEPVLALVDGLDPDGAEEAEEEGEVDEDGQPVARPARSEVVQLPSFTGMSLGEAIRAARRAGVELSPEGSGVAVAQSPAPGPVTRGALCRVSFRPPGG